MGVLTHVRNLRLRTQRSLSILVLATSIAIIGLVDLTFFPELPAVLAYELMLLAAVIACVNLIYLTKKH